MPLWLLAFQLLAFWLLAFSFLARWLLAFWLLAFWFVLGAGDVFLTECQTRVVDGFSMVEVDCGALESQFVRLCSSADMLNRSDMPVFDIDSPVVRSAFRANKHRQGWSLHNHFLFPQHPFLKKPFAPTPLLPSMSVSPPEKPLSWVSSLADQHQTVVKFCVFGPFFTPPGWRNVFRRGIPFQLPRGGCARYTASWFRASFVHCLGQSCHTSTDRRKFK